MAQATYKTAIEFTLKWEVGIDRKTGRIRTNGGYTNDPRDPGGETKWGISKRWHPHLDVKNLTLEEALGIYREEYWDVYKAKTPSLDLDSCSPDLAVSVFDCGVNCGVNRAFHWYIQAAKESDPVKAFNCLRQEFYETRPDWMRPGLLNRLNDLKKLVEIIRADAST